MDGVGYIHSHSSGDLAVHILPCLRQIGAEGLFSSQDHHSILRVPPPQPNLTLITSQDSISKEHPIGSLGFNVRTGRGSHLNMCSVMTCMDYPELTRFPRVAKSWDVAKEYFLPWNGEGSTRPRLPDGWQQVNGACSANEERCSPQLCFSAQRLASRRQWSLWPLALVKTTLPRS